MKNKLFLLLILPLLTVANIFSQIGGFTEPVLLDKDINSEAEEARAILSNDGTKIYFTRSFDENSTGGLYDQETWSAEIKDGNIKKSAPISTFNNKFNNSIVGISNDGKTLYLLDAYSGKKDEKKGCSVSNFENDSWSKPMHLDITDLDIDGEFYGFYVTKNEKVIIISYSGPNSLGEEDLYVSLNENDSWGKPIHLGSQINTIGYEISPFINESLDTLFFSSNGRGGEGDADIFYSIRGENSWTEWSEPRNLGPIINSSKFDAYFTMHGSTAYWSSNKESERTDIYSATILPPAPIEITTDIKMPSSFDATDGEVNITVSSGEGPFEVLWSDGSSDMNRTGLGGGSYSVTITDKFGISKTIEFEVEKPEMKQKDLNNLLVNVKPIYFDLGKHKIREDAKTELDKIIKIMNDNPTIQIELGSHTDCIASKKYNMRLSNKRAKSSADYIKQKISNPNRISGQGYGETMLKVDCPCEGKIKSTCSDEEHQMNRRTEFVLIEEGSPKYAEIVIEKVTPSNPNNTVKVNYNTDKSKKTNWLTDIPVTDEQKENIKNGFYFVQKGETLYRVAVNTGVTTNDLRRLNNLQSNSIKPGTKLKLK